MYALYARYEFEYIVAILSAALRGEPHGFGRDLQQESNMHATIGNRQLTWSGWRRQGGSAPPPHVAGVGHPHVWWQRRGW